MNAKSEAGGVGLSLALSLSLSLSLSLGLTFFARLGMQPRAVGRRDERPLSL